ncbi:arginine--tRNA ligase [Usitatibacter palustris]|uniref:Arginine--tRNA ligase n=1 Tax=Usitatibacter palustris TaxID=2732487 RepID=A0A6M4HDV7_9PROT|nr:arginine--tRNA ligase [Usitatibacter palustris]QJR16928.1 Arginine--tRNA ligase [Usitatibacter palustris]
MSPDPKSRLASLIDAAVRKAFPDAGEVAIDLDRPKNAAHGDFSCNVALQLSKRVGRKPREAAEAIVAALGQAPEIERTEIAGPGFINFTLAKGSRFAVVSQVHAKGKDFGRTNLAGGKKIMVEFVSANPTGPLHVGHGRQAALGDAIATLLEWEGWSVTREFYYNDAGNQIANLALSVQARIKQERGESVEMPKDGYNGEYIRDIAREYAGAHFGDAHGNDLDQIRQYAVQYLRKEQDLDLQAFGVKFDSYFLESSLYTDGKVDETVNLLTKAGHSYESEGAQWLRTTDFGDDKDRVMRKGDGTYTYFVPDVAYHLDKYRRGFEHVVNVQGSDHHSTVTRVRAGLQALEIGVPKGYPDYVLHKMVKVMRGGEEVKMSKRAGDYVTVRDLVDEVGRDAVRYFFLMRTTESELMFDIELAKSKSDENPAYYVQYAHARVCSVLREWGGDVASLANVDLTPLESPYEVALAQKLAEFPEIVAYSAREFAPHLLTYFLHDDVAARLHTYYNAERFLVEDEKVKLARLSLVAATRQVLANGLAALGVSAPERM